MGCKSWGQVKKRQIWQNKKLKLGNASSASEKLPDIPPQQVPTQAEMDQAKEIQELQEQVAKLTQRQTSGGNARNAGGRQNNGQCQPNQRGPVDYTSFKCYKCGVMGHIAKFCTAPGQQINGVPVTQQNGGKPMYQGNQLHNYSRE